MTTLEGTGRESTGLAVRYRTFISRRSTLLPTFAAIAILFVLLIAAEVLLRGDFITARNLSSLLLDNAYLLILAVGMTFVIITGGIDLSVGSVMAFTGIWLAELLAGGMSPLVAVPTVLLVGALIGVLVGVLVVFFDVQPFIASLAGLFLARGLAFVVSLESIRVDSTSLLWLQSTRIRFGEWYVSPTGILALAVMAVGAYVMGFTRFGRTIYAIGGNRHAALMGLKVARTTVLVYVISGLCGGLAGVVLTAYSGAGYPRNGIGTELDVIAAVVIGGTLLTGGSGYVLGSLVGVLVYGTIITIISFMGAEQAWTKIIIGALLLLFIVAQRAIIARSERRR